jgi:hypothetical protein
LRGRILGAALALSSIALAASSCSSAESLGRGFDIDSGVPGSSFTNTDASLADEAEAGLTSYCPSNKCPAGWTTCPGSRFPCDVNLQADRANCGACGHGCPSSGRHATYECSDGQCIMACGSPPENIDCDGVPDNGCETKSTTNENCGGCGIQCPDPDKPCMTTSSEVRCGCPDGLLRCVDPGSGLAKCVDPRSDDANCGACQNACDPEGAGGERPANTYYGCFNSECGKLKCESNFMNCDKDMANGCEAFVLSQDNCGTCGNACGPGLECKGNEGAVPTCSCPGGQTYCPYFWIELGDTTLYFAGRCTDVGSDRENCGACYHSCPYATAHSAPTCTYGMCGRQCAKGWADCNGNPVDDCEVNTDSDPRNCGGCGNVCDAIAGQACVGGRCVLEPCAPIQDDGGIAR